MPLLIERNCFSQCVQGAVFNVGRRTTLAHLVHRVKRPPKSGTDRNTQQQQSWAECRQNGAHFSFASLQGLDYNPAVGISERDEAERHRARPLDRTRKSRFGQEACPRVVSTQHIIDGWCLSAFFPACTYASTTRRPQCCRLSGPRQKKVSGTTKAAVQRI